jgi:hypothetical protein
VVEGDLEAGAELAGDLPLLEGAGLGDQADADAVGAELLDAPDLGGLQDLRGPVGVDVEVVGDLLDGAGGVVEVGRVGDLDVDQGPGPALGAVADAASTTSPTPYWSSISMKMPEMKSRTRFWEPNPTATPTIPAPAISGPRSTPTVPSAISPARVQMPTEATLFSRAPTVSARWTRRRLGISPVRARAEGARRAARPPSSVMCSTIRRMARRTSRLATQAATRIRTAVAGSMACSSRGSPLGGRESGRSRPP